MTIPSRKTSRRRPPQTQATPLLTRRRQNPTNLPPRPTAQSLAPDYSSSRTGLKNLDSTDPDARISDGAGGYIYDPKLAKQDIKIGGFYYTNQDYKGAYSRFKEATKVDPTNPDAVSDLPKPPAPSSSPAKLPTTTASTSTPSPTDPRRRPPARLSLS